MPEARKRTPLSVRLPPEDVLWFQTRALRLSKPGAVVSVHSLLIDACRAFRERAEAEAAERKTRQ